MTQAQPPADDLRRHLAEDAGAAGPCPSDDAWWDGWRSELSPEEFGALVDHAAACARCSLASRAAREMVRDLEPERFRGRSPSRGRFRIAIAAAAAVLVAVAGLAIVPWLDRPRDDGMRGAPEEALRSLIDEERPVSRASCRLRWAAGPEGTVYHVEIADEAMRALASGRSLRIPEFLVPEEALAGLPAGARILWQVHAIEPDGRQSASRTHFAVLD